MRPRLVVGGWGQTQYIARMIFARVIRAMYAAYTSGLTRRWRWASYNAAMDSYAPFRQRLARLPARGIDLALAVALTAFIELEGVGWLGTDASFHNPAVNVVIALLMTAPLIWRRRFPLAVFVVVFFGISATFAGDVTAHAPIVWGAVIALVLAAYSVGSDGAHGTLSLAVLIATATLIVAAFGGGLPAPPDFAVPYVILVLPWLIGHALRARQLRGDAFRERALRLEQEQEFVTRAALAQERARIARELHDVVAHNVSMMVVQAGAARTVLEPMQPEVHQALLSVEASGRQAMTELRTLLNVLGDDGAVSAAGGPSLAPQPGLGEVEPLVKRVADAHLPVHLRIDGVRRPLPPGIDLVAYRIVQEALTNSLKHSGLARTQVILDYRETELKVEILDEGAGAPVSSAGETRADDRVVRGHGLVGMRERVALYGGKLEAGPRLERGYAVRAWLPLPRD